MKKYPLIAGLGLLATCGAVFAAWSFGYTPTASIDDSLSVNIGVDQEWGDIGMHGTLTLAKPSIETVGIVQNNAKNSAKFDYSGSDVFTLTYSDPADGNPDPSAFSFTVNAVVSSNLDTVGGIAVNSSAISLEITQAAKTASVSVSDLLAKVTFPAIKSEKQADAFVAAVKAVKTPKITITFTAAA